MHMQGEPRTMQLDPRYDDVVADVTAFLEERLAFAVAEGIPRTRLPRSGFGFGKTPDQNLQLLQGLRLAGRARRPGARGPLPQVDDRSRARRSRVAHGQRRRLGGRGGGGVRSRRVDLRVHDVRPHVEALALAAAVERGGLVA